MPVIGKYEMRTQEAEHLVRELKITSLPIDPIEIAENEDIAVEPMPPDNQGVSGMLLKSGDQFGIAYATHIKNEGFQRFSIAHELGHYFIPGHPEQLIPLSSGQHFSRAGFTSKEDIEIEADHFAAGLLMPKFLFMKEVSKAGYGLDAVESLSEKCITSITATAIRYAQLSDIQTAIVISSNDSIDYAFMSDSLKEMKGIEWLKKGMRLPLGTVTASFNKDQNNITNCIKDSNEIYLQDWFGGKKNIIAVEEVVGLGDYGKTLTVITIEDGFDEEELLEEEEMEESWNPIFRK